MPLHGRNISDEEKKPMCSHNLEMCRLNELSTLDIPSLMHWVYEINNMLLHVPPVIFKHIYREHNMLADGLSKQALDLELSMNPWMAWSLIKAILCFFSC